MLSDMPLRLEDGKSNAYYLEVPVHFGYKHTVSDKFALFGEFGPYFACGLFGKTSSNALDYDDNFDFVSESEKPDTFDEFKRFDFGLGFSGLGLSSVRNSPSLSVTTSVW